MATLPAQSRWLLKFVGVLILLTACTGSPAPTDTVPPTVVSTVVVPTPAPVTSGGSAHSEAAAHYQLGDAFTARHDYKNAIVEYSQAIVLDPAYVDAYIYRGSAYENQGQSDLARKDYDAALKLDPASAITYFKRAILFYDTGNSDLALQDLSKAIELEPQFAQAYVNRGLIYDERGEYDQALADFDHALQLTSSDPELAGYYFNRAVTHYHQKNYERSVSDITQAIKLKPDYAKAFFLRGAILARTLPQDARNDLETALKLGLEPQLESQAKQLLEQLSTP
jgi:tetratricopeptide (TPR) repeat protein